MIRLVRFNGAEIWVNPDQLMSVEATPDTVVTFCSGEKLVVKDQPEEITKRFIDYQRSVHIRSEL